MLDNTVAVMTDDGLVTIEMYEYSRELYPAVVKIFDELRQELICNVNVPRQPFKCSEIDLGIEETGQFIKEACRILKLNPLAVIGLSDQMSDWVLTHGLGIEINTVSSHAVEFIRDMFKDSVLNDIMTITTTEENNVDDGIGLNTNVKVIFDYTYRDYSLARQYGELFKTVLGNHIGI